MLQVLNLFIFRDLVLRVDFRLIILVVIVYFLDKHPMSFDGPAVIMQPQSVAGWVFVVVEDHFLAYEAFGVEGHVEVIGEFSDCVLGEGVIYVIGHIIVLLVYSELGVVGLLDSALGVLVLADA